MVFDQNVIILWAFILLVGAIILYLLYNYHKILNHTLGIVKHPKIITLPFSDEQMIKFTEQGALNAYKMLQQPPEEVRK